MPHRLLLDGTNYLSLDGTNRLVLDATPIASLVQTVPPFTQSMTVIHPPVSAVFSQTVNPFTITTGPIPNFVHATGQKKPLGHMHTGGRPRRAT